MSVKERLKEYLSHKNLRINYFEKSIGASNSFVNNIRVSISPDKLENIANIYKDLNITWLLTGEGEMIKMEGRSIDENFTVRESDTEYQRNELVEKKYKGSTPVRVVTTKARAGWSDAYYSEEYLADMPLITIETDENYKGEYLAFEVDGDSMEPEYFPGDIVICRMVKRDLWQYKLHYDQYDFVIAHSTRGIMLKEIVDHDTETGMITCHSLNSAHRDFTLNLREVAYLYNVVEVRQSGKSKKRRR